LNIIACGEKVEELFADQKGSFGNRQPRAWYPDNLRERPFVQFVRLGYCCFITKKIKEVRKKTGKNRENKSEKLNSFLEVGASHPESP